MSNPEELMPSSPDPVRALIEQWRADSNNYYAHTADCTVRRSCADELEELASALAAPTVQPGTDAQKIRILEAKLAGAKRQVERWNLCPDHRDKATGRCMVCDGERRGREEARSSAPPVHSETEPRLSDGDIDSICQAIDNFVIGPVENDELRSLWQPYIDKLQALKSSAQPVPQAPTTAPMWPYAPLPPQLQKAVDEWCRSNKGGPSEFYHGVLPLGMVAMWMDRAKRAETPQIEDTCPSEICECEMPPVPAETEPPPPPTLNDLATYLGWGGGMTPQAIFDFAVEREGIVRVAQELLETQKSDAPTAATAVVERINALKASAQPVAAPPAETEKPMALVDSIELTDADRHKWRHMDNDDGRRAMKHVAAQDNLRLISCLKFTNDGEFDYQGEAFVALLAEFRSTTNPAWLSARVATELYERGQIDEHQLDRVCA